jgi:hypothetical protein
MSGFASLLIQSRIAQPLLPTVLLAFTFGDVRETRIYTFGCWLYTRSQWNTRRPQHAARIARLGQMRNPATELSLRPSLDGRVLIELSLGITAYQSVLKLSFGAS